MQVSLQSDLLCASVYGILPVLCAPACGVWLRWRAGLIQAGLSRCPGWPSEPALDWIARLLLAEILGLVDLQVWPAHMHIQHGSCEWPKSPQVHAAHVLGQQAGVAPKLTVSLEWIVQGCHARLVT